mmetsp:Transcript_25464/g.62790  ORF Transcript_25464/g.62790 Transcript_25464/m.62790 type:complete len:397 (+) Transcript_25464:196-1386(+)|eukprot:CAMPEP_0197578098 /NCGR_PEP_ID=MMETSP1326-20131121/2468_1 /TAXON_ID=1155430 /ORGANISM="Genus nov. species nov., Strain RCC2288" /LENGTH=396 /DNA_ID=CAMNT_0043141257 /DNA_START=150 /DNA_END=1340 /DNA_ORIENTATION=-
MATTPAEAEAADADTKVEQLRLLLRRIAIEPKLSEQQRAELLSAAETVSGVIEGDYAVDASEAGSPEGSADADIDSLLTSDVKAAMEGYKEWEFDIWKVEELKKRDGALVLVALQIFKDHDLCKKFSIPESKLIRFLRRIQAGYNAVPYHNSVHAADVLQTFNYFAVNGDMHWMTPLELFASLFACIVHDFKHPGVNNNFLALTQDTIALRYNDKSILENYHLAQAFFLLRDDSVNILEGLQSAQRAEFRSLCISLVLATDMEQHFSFVGFVRHKVESGGVDYNNREDRCLALKMVLKSADISNPAKPLPTVRTWTSRVMEEFFNQGDLEKAKGMAISPLCDRATVSIPNSQTGFIRFVVLPLFELLSTMIPLARTKCIPFLNCSIEHWESQEQAK